MRRFRRISISALGLAVALAVSLGLSTGTASAAAHPSDWNDFTCTGVAGALGTGCTLVNGHPLPTGITPCTIATGATSCTADLPSLGLGLRGPFGGGLHLGGNLGLLGGALNGQFLNLGGGGLNLAGINPANQFVNVCGYPSLGAFNSYAGGLSQQWGGIAQQLALSQSIWQQQVLAQAGCAGSALNGQFLNLGDLGLSGVSSVNLCQAATLEALRDEIRAQHHANLGSQWNVLLSSLGDNERVQRAALAQLRAQAACSGGGISTGNVYTPGGGGTTIINNNSYQTPVAPAPAAAPLSNPQVSQIPSLAPRDGDGSVSIG
jgi:hypothetical protein